jgi:hypothetical protein
MTTTHHPLTLAVTLASVSLLLTEGCARPEDAPGSLSKGTVRAPAAASAVSPSKPVVPLAALDARTLGWELGRRYSYRLKLTTEIAVADGPKNFDFDLTGNAAVVPVAVTPDVATLYVSLGDATIVSRVSGNHAELDKVAAQIRAAGVFFTLSGGRGSEMRFPPGQSAMASTSYRQIASALQFARASGNVKQYAAEEYDNTGRYVAQYDAGADGTTWSKKKQRYVALLGPTSKPGNQSVPIVPEVESEGEIRLSPEGRPERVRLRDEVVLAGAQVPMNSTVVIELTAGAAPPALAQEPNWNALMAAFQRVSADQPIGVAAPVEDLDAARIGAFDFETLLSRLEALAKEKQLASNTADPVAPKADAPPSDEERAKSEAELREDSKLFSALSALFRQEPRTVEKAVHAIRAKSPASETLLDALSSASSDQAQGALVKVMGDKAIDTKLRTRAIDALVRTPKPNEASALALRAKLADDPFNEQALYGLGTYSRLLRDAGKAKQAKTLGELLASRLARATVSMDIVTVLRSIANSGYAGALSRVTPYLGDERERVRVAAVRALQSMRDPKIDGILASRMKTDASRDVRIAAMAAAKVREPSDELTGAVASAGTEASDAQVRFRAVELMIRWLPQRPDLRVALERVAQKDAEPKVRNRAQAAL